MKRLALWSSMPVHPVDVASLTQQIETALGSREPCTVAFANAHMGYLYGHDERLRKALDNFDVVAPDGWPVARAASRSLGSPVGRLSGPEFLPELFSQAVKRNWRIALLAASDHAQVRTALEEKFPGVQVSYSAALPFYPTSPSDEEVNAWFAANPFVADVVLVGIGCPKQELFAAALAPLVRRPVLAVGQALQIAAGLRPKPPRLVTRVGMEWAWRLSLEPRRLGRRYWQSAVFTAQSALFQRRLH